MTPHPSLARMQLLDCEGRVSHTLILDFDGTVIIEFASGCTARVEPRTRCNLTPHIRVHDALFDQAAILQPS